MSIFIYPYKVGSASATALKDALGARMIRRENSRFVGSEDKIVINWGNSVTPEEIEKANVLNKASAVKLATNKRTFFQAVDGQVSIPEYTTEFDVASTWVGEGQKVVVRESLTGHSGQGIVIIEDEDGWEEYNHKNARLYVKYIPKKDEYRVHVVNGEVVDTQQKAVRRGSNNNNFQIRSHANGFIFKRENVKAPNSVLEEAVKAVGICGLHFGAVDVIYNTYRKAAYVLEINTAPGLEGATVDTYVDAFVNLTVEDVQNRRIRRVGRRLADVPPMQEPHVIPSPGQMRSRRQTNTWIVDEATNVPTPEEWNEDSF